MLFVNQLGEKQAEAYPRPSPPQRVYEEADSVDDTPLGEQPYINHIYSDSSYLSAWRSRVRLYAGLTPTQGFLQIYNATLRSWTWLCDRQLTLRTAQVVCRQLGMEHRNALVQPQYHYMRADMLPPVWTQTFVCTGDESSLAGCHYYANNYNNNTNANTNHDGSDKCYASEYTYVWCNDYPLDAEGNYEAA